MALMKIMTQQVRVVLLWEKQDKIMKKHEKKSRFKREFFATS